MISRNEEVRREHTQKSGGRNRLARGGGEGGSLCTVSRLFGEVLRNGHDDDDEQHDDCDADDDAHLSVQER